MRQIIYPKGKALEDFTTKYYSFLNKSIEDDINEHLNNINFQGCVLSFKRLVTLSFEDLISLKPIIKEYSNSVEKVSICISGRSVFINPFEQLFDYKSNHNGIANFFMRQSDVKINTCYYCGIDYIDAFVDRDAYEGSLHFLNNAPIQDLKKIKALGDGKAKVIISARKIIDINNVGLSDALLSRIHNMEFVNSHNHFTLDHILPQCDYKFYSLCLFNFVPSCYSCNSKFKKDIDFIQDASIKEVSPTSSKYNLTNDITFNLYFNGQLAEIDKVQDFEVNSVVKNNTKQVNHYLSLFKINGRYNYHRAQLIPLIKNRVKYSESKIKEISGHLGMPQMELKKLLFGEDIIQDEDIDNPLFKMRKDIWNFINKNNE